MTIPDIRYQGFGAHSLRAADRQAPAPKSEPVDMVCTGIAAPPASDSFLMSPSHSVETVHAAQAGEPGTLKDGYRPAAEWSGRLILPAEGERKPDGGVYMELENTPERHSSLKGERVWLSYRGNSSAGERAASVIRDIHFSPASLKEKQKGTILPDRLDGLHLVSPLESLAGARPADDVRVMLEGVKVTEEKGRGTCLRIDSEPVMIEGSEVALVQVVSSEGERGERLRIRHYNRATGTFDGPAETLAMERRGEHDHPLVTLKKIEHSPLNGGGWYVYGHRDDEGRFLVRGLEPRELMKLSPGKCLPGLAASRDYIRDENWRGTPGKKGTTESVLLTPGEPADRGLAPSPAGETPFREGEEYLVLHLFGGIKGEGGDAPLPLVTPGHFSFGRARVVQDPFTGEPRFDVTYQQVYGQGPNGVIAGDTSWHSYMGGTARGWMYSRPVTDMVVSLPEMNRKFQVAGKEISFMDILQGELEKMMARYRIGDGDGAAVVNMANSCVQDSGQALYSAVWNFRTMTRRDPSFNAWVRNNPEHPDAIAFKKMERITSSLDRFLRPLGIVRSDWKAFAEEGAFSTMPAHPVGTAIKSILSRKTKLPRYANDHLAEILLDRGASLQVLKSAQIGGEQRNNYPVAPTYIFSRQ